MCQMPFNFCNSRQGKYIVVSIIAEIAALVHVCEIPWSCYVYRAHGLFQYIQQRNKMQTITLVSLYRSIIILEYHPHVWHLAYFQATSFKSPLCCD